MMKKFYYAYVAKDMIDRFQEKLDERSDKIKIICTNQAISENGETLLYYVLEAEKGIIDSKWELKH